MVRLDSARERLSDAEIDPPSDRNSTARTHDERRRVVTQVPEDVPPRQQRVGVGPDLPSSAVVAAVCVWVVSVGRREGLRAEDEKPDG